MKIGRLLLLMLGLVLSGTTQADDAKKLRIITWSDYVPAEVAAQFKAETGIQVELTLSNNEEMISKLRATGGAGFDLAQPSQDRIAGAQQEFRIYKPIDLSKVKVEQFVPELIDIVKKNASIDGKLYALPYIWGAEGLVVNAKKAKVADYTDLCKPELKGKTAVRLKRPTLMAFALASGKDPFSLYGDTKAYTALMDDVGRTLSSCKSNFRFFYDNKDQLLNGVRSGEIVAAMMWDSGGWTSEPREPGHPLRQPEVRRHRLDGHVRAARTREERRRRLPVDQLHDAARRSRPRSRSRSATSRRRAAPSS